MKYQVSRTTDEGTYTGTYEAQRKHEAIRKFLWRNPELMDYDEAGIKVEKIG